MNADVGCETPEPINAERHDLSLRHRDSPDSYQEENVTTDMLNQNSIEYLEGEMISASASMDSQKNDKVANTIELDNQAEVFEDVTLEVCSDKLSQDYERVQDYALHEQQTEGMQDNQEVDNMAQFQHAEDLIGSEKTASDQDQGFGTKNISEGDFPGSLNKV